MTVEPRRHTPLPVIEGYLTDSIHGVLGVAGEPPGRAIIDPHHHTISIQFPVDGRAPDIVELQNVSFDLVHDDGVMWHQLSIRLDDNVDEVYALLCAILDRVQLSGETFACAVEEALTSLSGILTIRRGLTREKQAGLFGELLVVLALAGDIGAVRAAGAWRGPLAEEHDFGLAEFDLEVKTTLSEQRHHWISSVTQLVPTGIRPLYLASIQLTAAALGTGWSLPSLVADVRSAAAVGVARLDTVLGLIGYHERDADLYRSRWTLRTPPAFYLVDSAFPALTQDGLDAAVADSQRITDVRYRIDLAGIPASEMSLSFGSVVATQAGP